MGARARKASRASRPAPQRNSNVTFTLTLSVFSPLSTGTGAAAMRIIGNAFMIGLGMSAPPR